MKAIAIAALISLCAAASVEAQEDSARSMLGRELVRSRSTNVNVYPFAFYNPELQLAFGAGGIITFYTGESAILRPSKISVSGFYSTSNQYNISLGPQVYLRNNLLFISSRFFYGDETYYTPDDDNPELDATSYGAFLEVRLAKAPQPLGGFTITDLKQLALIVDYEHVRFIDEPGFDDLPPHNFGVGVARLWDSRNNIFYPTEGKLLRIEALFYAKALGSSFDMNRYTADLRWYQPVSFERRQVVALQMYGEYLGGHPPLYQLPALGSSNLMRGYKSGTLRDRLYLAAQAEFRTHIWWRLGAVVFVGAGDIGSSFKEFGWKHIRPSYGGGLRVLFNKKEGVNLRADLGFGDDSDGIYFGIEESF
jgi:outer membrane protein assembly factor BamA